MVCSNTYEKWLLSGAGINKWAPIGIVKLLATCCVIIVGGPGFSLSWLRWHFNIGAGICRCGKVGGTN